MGLAVASIKCTAAPRTFDWKRLRQSHHAHPGFDGRAIALAAGTCQQLARIGVWQSLADCATAITTVHVSDRGHAGFVTLAAEDYQLAALGQGCRIAQCRATAVALLRKAPCNAVLP